MVGVMYIVNMRATAKALLKLDDLGYDVEYHESPINILTNGKNIVIKFYGKRVDFKAVYDDAIAALKKGGAITRRINMKIKELVAENKQPSHYIKQTEGGARVNQGADIIHRVVMHCGKPLPGKEAEHRKWLIPAHKIEKFEKATGLPVAKSSLTSSNITLFMDEWLELVNNVVTTQFGK